MSTDRDGWPSYPPPYPASSSSALPPPPANRLEQQLPSTTSAMHEHISPLYAQQSPLPPRPLSASTLTPTYATPPGPVAEFLASLNLSEYYHAFLQEGFDRMSSVMELTEDDLVAIGVKRGHRRTIQRQIATMKGIASTAPLQMVKRRAEVVTDAAAERRLGSPVSQVNSMNVVINKGGNPDVKPQEEIRPLKTGKRRYRRHPKPDTNAPEKPPSAYVAFSNGVRHELKGSKSFSELARIVGDRWKNLEPAHKESLEAAASRAKEQYHSALAAYKLTEEHATYQHYLADFRARHGQEEDMPPARGSKQQMRASRAASASIQTTPKASTSNSSYRKTPSEEEDDSEEEPEGGRTPEDEVEAESSDYGGAFDPASMLTGGRKRKRPSLTSATSPAPKRSTSAGSASSILLKAPLMPSPRSTFGNGSTTAVGPIVSSSRSTLEEPMSRASVSLGPDVMRAA